MKELSIEEKAKAYDKVLTNARMFYKDEHVSDDVNNLLEVLFPELKESEDDNIRRWIINEIKIKHHNLDEDNVDFVDKAIAWLEKQGTSFTKKDVDDAWLKGMCDARHELEKQSEQKPTDKVESKFKVDDWILYSGDHYEGVRHITKIDENGYYIERNGLPHGIIPFNHEICMRLWTIQDAKDGDVLSWDDSKCIALFKDVYDENSFESYGFVGHCTGIFESGLTYHDIKGAHPATKEQRDLLFQKMKEAGYEWDAEKKELRKIEQKPAWSEEGEKMIEAALQFAHEYGRHGLWCWLKSLKDKCTWKPSDEQMDALYNALSLANNCGEESAFDLRTLHEQLKKLRNE